METYFKHDQPSRFDVKTQRKADTEANWRKVCKQVNTRDGYKCRACGTSGNPDGIDPLDKLHRHHLTFRSQGGQDVASNLLLLCARCHDLLHVKRALRIEALTAHGADGPCQFWKLPDHDGGTGYLIRRELAVRVVEQD